MIAAVLKETFPGERRVALLPDHLAALRKSGWDLHVQAGAGIAAGMPDQVYADKGARMVADRAELLASADLVAQVRVLGANLQAGREDLAHFKAGQVIVGFCEPLSEPQAAAELARRGVRLLALELLPRITRAQSMDALSSMATIAGYKAVLLAAATLPKMFPMMMTAAGTVSPARVFIVGAGVAGLQAIASARRLGALVSAYDVRPAVKEQVQSLGAQFVEMTLDASQGEDRGGYAKAMDEEFYRKQRQLMTKVVSEADVVITTAAVPGKKAPTLVTADMVEKMAPHAVIVDLAAERGGNCELTRPGETLVHNGVTIIGALNLPSTVPLHASQLYGKNVANVVQHITRDGRIDLNMDDEIIREMLACNDGEVIQPKLRELLGLPALAGAAAAQPARSTAAAMSG